MPLYPDPRPIAGRFCPGSGADIVPPVRWRPLPLICLLALLAGCGGGNPVEVRIKGKVGKGNVLGFPVLATKNTTRVAGSDPVQDAAGAASAVYPAIDGRQPQAVTLVDKEDWRGGIAAAALMAPPLRAPILLTDGGIPDVTRDALDLLRPTGAPLARRMQVFKVGKAAEPDGLRTQPIVAKDPFQLAAAIDAFRTRANGSPSPDVVVVPAQEPRFAMPAAAWAAKSGDAVLFTARDELPPATRKAISAHERPGIYVLGPSKVISGNVVRELRKLGNVIRIAGETPVQNAIAFSRFSDGAFGWGVQDPGHGLVIVNWNRPLDAAAAAPLSASGTYGPLLLTDSAKLLPPRLRNYLLDIQPGFRSEPVRGVYNHAWLIGDESAVSVAVQAEIDDLTEIVRVKGQ
jgi:putative cell wall binding repeat protein